jgi:hypothetical protein
MTAEPLHLLNFRPLAAKNVKKDRSGDFPEQTLRLITMLPFSSLKKVMHLAVKLVVSATMKA